MYQDTTPPVSEGQELEVTIEAVGAKGDGIAKVKGFVLFVPGTAGGDRVKVRITKVLHNVGFAEVLQRAGGTAEAPAAEEAQATEETPQPQAEDSETFGDE